VLEIQAVDRGTPVLSTSVLVNVNIEDANDNSPIFAEGNYTVYVQEDKPLGHILLRFTVTDADAAPNAAPFTW
jgi:protocadherin Fat 1/2/3